MAESCAAARPSPIRSIRHVSALPARFPSSGSEAEPAKASVEPVWNDCPSEEGVVMDGFGAWLTGEETVTLRAPDVVVAP